MKLSSAKVKRIAFTDVTGVTVGHAQDMDAGTGCTVVITEQGATAGVDVRGGAPGTRETDLLDPVNLVEKIHAVVLAGGSAYGLDAASGVMQYLEEREAGFDVGVTTVPIVCGAVLFDLMVGDHRVRPDRKMGYIAARNSGAVECSGCIGAGTGASVGKILGSERAMKTGLGSFAVQIEDLQIGALVAVNCLGDVVDPDTGEKLAGLLNEGREGIEDTETVMISMLSSKSNLFAGNTTIGVVATNAALTKSQSTKLASMAQDGYARTMSPAHSMYDGDTIFTMATGEVEADLSSLGMLATRVMERAVVDAVRNARSMYGLISHSDLGRVQ